MRRIAMVAAVVGALGAGTFALAQMNHGGMQGMDHGKMPMVMMRHG
jgi:hypothetical protein